MWSCNFPLGRGFSYTVQSTSPLLCIDIAGQVAAPGGVSCTTGLHNSCTKGTSNNIHILLLQNPFTTTHPRITVIVVGYTKPVQNTSANSKRMAGQTNLLSFFS